MIIDANTGAMISHEEKQKPLASFEVLAKDLDKQKQNREQIFAQEMSSMKDRERLLEREVPRGDEARRQRQRQGLPESARSGLKTPL